MREEIEKKVVKAHTKRGVTALIKQIPSFMNAYETFYVLFFWSTTGNTQFPEAFCP